MFTLYKKELRSFFSSLIGYLTIGVFLVLTGLMLWVFRSDFNILDYGYASLEGLFLIGPFLYLFLIPAITMRSLAEERRSGTIEMLMTRPVSDWTIVVAKILAAWTLVAVSLLPTLTAYFSVVALGDPVGNIDTGSVVGSYIGLLLLGGAFVAIGVFCSSLTNNQIVSFILSALLCVVMYLGFESLYNMNLFGGGANYFVKRLGASHHYESLSRGVIDTRDVLYFLSLMVLFAMATRLVLQSRQWGGWQGRKSMMRSHLLEMTATLLIVVFVDVIGHFFFYRFDLTAERRYTLSRSTKEMLRKIDEPVLFRVYLEGEFPADFKRLQSETKEMLNQFRAYNSNIDYEFFNPNSFTDREEQQVFYQKLARRGIQPTQIQVEGNGGVTSQILVPAADVYYRGNETTVQLLQNQKYVSDADLLNNSIQNLEYSLSSAIRALAKGPKQTIGFLQGHGELSGPVIYDFQRSLQDFYNLDYVTIDGQIQSLTAHKMNDSDSSYRFYNLYDLLIVAKPTQPFSDRDLYILDQYIMYGGKVLWLIDPLDADLDSLASHGQFVATRYPLGLDEMLFTYGVRINPDLVMDIRCRPIPIQVGMVGEKPQFRFRPWYYFPEIVPVSPHPIVRNLDLIKTDFVSSIDLIDNDIQKTVLLATSEYSRVKNAPVLIDLADAQGEPDRQLYNRSSLPVAVLLEGEFLSAWRNRLSPFFTNQPAMGFREQSDPTKMIVIADGDVVRNRYMASEGTVLPLGYDLYTQTQYANKDFLLGAVNYLVGDEGLMASRTRTVKLRKLDVLKCRDQRTLYQIINIGIPLALLALTGVAVYVARRKKYKK